MTLGQAIEVEKSLGSIHIRFLVVVALAQVPLLENSRLKVPRKEFRAFNVSLFLHLSNFWLRQELKECLCPSVLCLFVC